MDSDPVHKAMGMFPFHLPSIHVHSHFENNKNVVQNTPTLLQMEYLGGSLLKIITKFCDGRLNEISQFNIINFLPMFYFMYIPQLVSSHYSLLLYTSRQYPLVLHGLSCCGVLFLAAVSHTLRCSPQDCRRIDQQQFQQYRSYSRPLEGRSPEESE